MRVAATGQKSKFGPNALVPIYVWDIETREVLAVLKGFIQGAAYILKFSPDGSKLLCIGKDADHSIAIYDWANQKLIASSKVDKSFVTDAAFKNDTEFVTVGTRHIKFWSMKGGILNFKRGIWKNQDNPEPLMSCVFCFAQKVCFTGGASGKIYTWSSNSAVGSIDAHSNSIRVLLEHKNSLYSGGDDGIVKMWSYTSKLQKQADDLFAVGSENGQPQGIRSLDLKSDGTLLVATRSSTIYEVEVGEHTNSVAILEGHYNGELWGLAVNPKAPKFVTVGDDKTIRIWDTVNKEQHKKRELSYGGRAVDWSTES